MVWLVTCVLFVYCSVRIVEATVKQLLEDNDVVVGVRFQERGSDETRVNNLICVAVQLVLLGL